MRSAAPLRESGRRAARGSLAYAAPTPAVTISIAGLAVRVASDDAAWVELVRERHAGFVTDDPPRLELRARIGGPVPADLVSPLATRAEERSVHATGRGFVIAGETFSAEVDLAARRAELCGPRALYPLDSGLRHTLPILLEDGVIVHGGAAVEGELGVAFCGVSGAGKTTLGELLVPRTVCDEMTALVVRGGRAELRSTPYWRARPAVAPLKAVYLLSHGPRHRRVRLDEGEALRALTAHVLWPVHHADGLERCFRALGALVAAVPVWSLAFAPTADVWEVMVAGAQGTR